MASDARPQIRNARPGRASVLGWTFDPPHPCVEAAQPALMTMVHPRPLDVTSVCAAHETGLVSGGQSDMRPKSAGSLEVCSNRPRFGDPRSKLSPRWTDARRTGFRGCVEPPAHKERGLAADPHGDASRTACPDLRSAAHRDV